MAQTRYINFGDTVLAARINEISTAIVVPAVLEGAAMSVGVGGKTVVVGPNKVMLQDLLLVENSSTSLLIENLPSAATDYTVVYEHTNQQVQGGVPAEMVLKEGLFGFDDLENTVVLGWVRWPGGAAGSLNTTMFIEAPKLQIGNPSDFASDIMLPPYVPNIYIQQQPVSLAITQTDAYNSTTLKAYMELENTGVVLASITQYAPFASGIQAPNKLILEANVDLGASVQVALIDEEGTSYAATNGSINNTSGIFEYREMAVINVDITKFDQNRPYFVSLTTQLNPGRKALISIVGTSSNFLPV